MKGFLKPTTVECVDVTVSVPKGSEENLRKLVAKLSAKEIELLRKVSENPALKAMAFSSAQKYV